MSQIEEIRARHLRALAQLDELHTFHAERLRVAETRAEAAAVAVGELRKFQAERTRRAEALADSIAAELAAAIDKNAQAVKAAAKSARAKKAAAVPHE